MTPRPRIPQHGTSSAKPSNKKVSPGFTRGGNPPTFSLTGRVVASMIRVLPGTIITFLVYENVNKAFERS
jgi:hypothetical protein